VKLSGTGNNSVSWIKGVGNYMIKEVKLKIGGEVISRMSGEYIDIYHKYYFGTGHYNTYSAGVRNIQGHTNTSLTSSQVVLVPLPFWFTKDISQALPLVSLQYSTIEIEIDFRPIEDLLFSGANKSGLNSLVDLSTLGITECFLYGEYIYLDKDERIDFAKRDNIDYLIEQIQEETFIVEQNTKQKTYKLNFNLPSKELLWFYRSNDYENINRWNLYNHLNSNNRFTDPIINAGISLNGNDRVESRVSQYYRIIVPLYSHNSSNNDLIYFYNFSLDCDNNQPSGAINFSRIDDTRLNIEWSNAGNNGIKTGTLFVMCVNYNFLKIKKGMAGILYQ
jgi:hypothetical protein